MRILHFIPMKCTNTLQYTIQNIRHICICYISIWGNVFECDVELKPVFYNKTKRNGLGSVQTQQLSLRLFWSLSQNKLRRNWGWVCVYNTVDEWREVFRHINCLCNRYTQALDKLLLIPLRAFFVASATVHAQMLRFQKDYNTAHSVTEARCVYWLFFTFR